MEMPRLVPREVRGPEGASEDDPAVRYTGSHLRGMEANDPGTNVSHTPMWTLDELCEKLHTTPRVVHAWRRRGTAPKAYKVGRHLLFDENDIATWLSDHASERPGNRAATNAAADDGDGSGW
ncbi:hypothetical protein GCM10027054_10510 [Isoptericola nanjingensis]